MELVEYLYNNINKIYNSHENNKKKYNIDKNSFYKLLKSKKSNEAKTDNAKYYILVGNNEEMIKIFAVFLIFYKLNVKDYKDINKSKKIHIGIDYEFTQRVISLMQINFDVFDYHDDKEGYIWIVNPGTMNKDVLNILIDNVITNTKIYKILHGADSQDIPYMYSQMLEGDNEKIKLFTKKLIDTRFLCEFFKISVDEDRKCSIYEALKYFDVITKKKYDELNKIFDSMGPVQDIVWDINKMSSFHLQYSFYDVIYLKDYLYNIYKRINKENPTTRSTYKYINQIVRLVMLEKREITKITEKAKTLINPINNYLIKKNDKNLTLVTIYNDVVKDMELTDGNNIIKMNLILGLNYTRTTFSFILKNIVYHIVSKKYKIYKNKNKMMTEKIPIDHILDEVKNLKYKCALKLINLFMKAVYKKIE